MTPPTGKALVYLAGAPGVGKSTLMRELTAGCTRTLLEHPFAHDWLTLPHNPGYPAVELGRRRDAFSGTDALPLNVQPKAVGWISAATAALVLAEGDRLANLGFLLAGRAGGYAVSLLLLEAPADLLDARCAARGSTQSDSWRAGRATKVNRLAAHAESAGLHVRRLDATQPVAHVLYQAYRAAPHLRDLSWAA